jgi:8-oxo-dGTP diphosphatase
MAKMKTTTEKHLRFAVIATDVAIFTVRDKQLFVRLMGVHRPPHFSNAKGLPGGLIHPSETAEEAVRRILEEKAHIDSNKTHLEQLYTFSDIARDPRNRVLSVAYTALIAWERLSPTEQLDTIDAWWCPVLEATKLAYDHDEILSTAVARLRSRITYTTVIGKLMPREFTLTELEQTYESILKTNLDKRNFRKKMAKISFITALPHKRTGGAFRPAQLYKVSSEKVKEVEVL